MKTTNRLRTLLLVFALLAAPVASYAQAWGVGVSIGIAPPSLPVYVQPPCPTAGYIWTPGYWAYDPEEGQYYWVPGTWVVAPAPGLLWTPGYWGFDDGLYAWHAGYWGPHIGFYGGVNYGFGYFGTGFAGGYWHGDRFFYNRSVTNVTNISVTNVYNQTVVNNTTVVNRTSFNGGPHGIQLRPTLREQEAARAPHYQPTAEQLRHVSAARAMPALRESVNHGQPPVAATARPAVFTGHDVRAAQGREAAARDLQAGQGREAPARDVRAPQARETPVPRAPGNAIANRVETAPGRANVHPNPPQPPARWAGPERTERATPAYPPPAAQHPGGPANQYAQRGAPAPAYPQAAAPRREAPRAPAYAAPRGGGNQPTARGNAPREREGGQGRHEPGRE